MAPTTYKTYMIRLRKYLPRTPDTQLTPVTRKFSFAPKQLAVAESSSRSWMAIILSSMSVLDTRQPDPKFQCQCSK